MVSSDSKNDVIHIFIVDEQVITRELLTRAISTQGYIVSSASVVDEAFNLWL